MSREQSQLVLEIRYQPNAKVLDHRGQWAESVATQMSLPHWLIVDNRLDVFDEEQTTRCFVGFRNVGYVTANPPTNNFFADQCIKFIRFVMALEGFQSPLLVGRIGVRSRALKPFDGTMEELVGRYKTRYYGVKPEAERALNGELVDIGGALNLKDKHGNFNTHGGPMPLEQAETFFPNGKDIPQVGLYFDIDYWVRPAKLMTVDEITKTIRQFSNESITKSTQVADLITGELPHVEEAWIAGPEAQRPARPNA